MLKNIRFSKSVVAFIDVLGFSSMVRKAEHSEEELRKLEELISILKDSVDILNRGSKKLNVKAPDYIYISDTIILHMKIDENEISASEVLERVIIRCIQLALLIMKMGYFVRGGVAMGKSWRDINNIVGSAYMEAYNIESKAAEYPCVMLSDKASKIWAKVVGKRKKEGGWEAICFKTTEKENYYVDILNDQYMQTPFISECIDNIVENYRQFYAKSIERLKQKYNESEKEYNDEKIKLDRRKEWFEGYAEERKKRNWYEAVEPLNI